MSIQKYTTKNGKIQWFFSVWYTDWTGKKKRKKQEGFHTQREAKEAQERFLASVGAGADITFEGLVQAYIENRSVRVEETTFVIKENMIKTKILPYFGKLPVNEIDSSTVMKWQTELIKYRNPKTGQPYSATYLRQIHNQLSAIFNFAIKFYGLKENPARTCGSMGVQKAKKFDFWTYDEFDTFIQATKDDITARTIFTLFFFSGVRLGELLALTLNDFDFQKNIVSVNKNFAVVKGKHIIKDTKTAKSVREIALPRFVMDLVKEYANALYDYNPVSRLFMVNKNALHNTMRKYCKISGIRKIKVHELRHSHASHLIELGVSPSMISERLGHEDVRETLNTYSHLYPDKQCEIAELLAKCVS